MNAQERDLVSRLCAHSTLTNEAITVLQQTLTERDILAFELSQVQRKYDQVQKGQYRSRYGLGVLTVVLAIACLGTVVSYYRLPDPALQNFAAGFGGAMVIITLGGLAIGSMVAGLAKWQEPKP